MESWNTEATTAARDASIMRTHVLPQWDARPLAKIDQPGFDDGIPPNMVQHVMGHERSSTTLDLYTRRTDNSDRIQRALDDEDDGDQGGEESPGAGGGV